jgi:hypothetical protein
VAMISNIKPTINILNTKDIVFVVAARSSLILSVLCAMTAIKVGVVTVVNPLIPKNSATIREKKVIDKHLCKSPFCQRIGIEH